MIVPSKIFPVQQGEVYPEATKLIEYFSKKKNHVPNMFLFELKSKTEKFIVAAFSKKNWGRDLVVDRVSVEANIHNDMDIDIYDPMSELSGSDDGD